ncbi:DUF2690 domain-containing protein [Streptomyces poriticola]|uniref:DUF2690 domain-containing protein n=1 Tax=Streptomyces poriticola TaxID=3120506 RepID=UPI002FCE2825
MSGQSLPPERVRLARELTVLRELTGLSLAALAAKTTASKSSWQRYLSGAQLPPRELVRDLAALAGRRAGPLLALWELAAAARPVPAPGAAPGGPRAASTVSGRPSATAHADSSPRGPGRGPEVSVPRPRRRPRQLAAALSSGLLLGVAAMGATLVIRSDKGPDPIRPGCQGAQCTGKRALPQACALAGGDLRTLAERRYAGRTALEIRYSGDCSAAWARLRFGRVGDRIEIGAPGQPRQSAEVADKYDAEGYLTTPMVGGGPAGLEACLVSAGTGERQCFPS